MRDNLECVEYYCRLCSKCYKRDEAWNGFVIFRMTWGLCPTCSEKVVKEVRDEKNPAS